VSLSIPEERGFLSNEVSPFFTGTVVTMDWSSSPNGNSVRLKIAEDALIHPFKGLNTDPRRQGAGQRLKITVTSHGRMVYDGQAILTWRGDDSQNGMTVSLKLEEVQNAHPFQDIVTDYYTGYRHRSGEPLHMQCWLVDDDETLVRPKIPFKDMSPVKQSQIKCRLDKDFQSFCADNIAMLAALCGEDIPEVSTDTTHQEFAENTVRLFCGVSSRSELNEDSRHGFDARMKWKLLLSLYERSPEAVSRYERFQRR